MVSVLQPFFVGASTMSFNQQRSDEEYERYWAQFATFPPVSGQANPSLQVPTVPSQPSWNDNFALGAYAQNTFYEEPQSLYPQTDFYIAPSQSASLPVSNVPSYQSSPAMAYSTPQVPSQSSYSSELAMPSSSLHPHRHSRQVSTHSMDSYTSTAGASTAGAPSPDASESNFSRSPSPGSADMSLYGYLNQQGTWSCAYPGCTSRAVFTRGCDLRKHHKRHTKSFFCRYPGCSQSSGGGFSSKKDLARHEAKHNPGVVCEWEGCDRVFSRVDNMVSTSQSFYVWAALTLHRREIMSNGYTSKQQSALMLLEPVRNHQCNDSLYLTFHKTFLKKIPMFRSMNDQRVQNFTLFSTLNTSEH